MPSKLRVRFESHKNLNVQAQFVMFSFLKILILYNLICQKIFLLFFTSLQCIQLILKFLKVQESYFQSFIFLLPSKHFVEIVVINFYPLIFICWTIANIQEHNRLTYVCRKFLCTHDMILLLISLVYISCLLWAL